MSKLRCFWLALMLWIGVGMGTDAAFSAPPSDIRYVKDHLFYHLGDEMNVIDIDMEWPELVDGYPTDSLRSYIIRTMFGISGNDFDAAYQTFKGRYGVPVTGKFSRLPDDKKYCYVDCRLKEMGHIAGRYVSYALDYISRPAALSSQRGDTLRRLVTFDLQNQRVLTMNDVLRMQRLKSARFPEDYFLPLAAAVGEDALEAMRSLTLRDACLMGDNAYMELSLETWHGEQIDFFLRPAGDKRRLLGKQAAELLGRDVPGSGPLSLAQPAAFKGERVYDKVDTPPRFGDGSNNLPAFFAQYMQPVFDEQGHRLTGKVTTRLIVDKLGNVDDIRVVGMSDPQLDREAVRLLALMPRWKPGLVDGKAVHTIVLLPIQFTH